MKAKLFRVRYSNVDSASLISTHAVHGAKLRLETVAVSIEVQKCSLSSTQKDTVACTILRERYQIVGSRCLEGVRLVVHIRALSYVDFYVDGTAKPRYS